MRRTGLTAPNGPSQQRVIRQALANAGLSAADVDAVEAHGTGTTLGDPIEAQALLATYGQDRPADRPLWLGSVKSNIGHTQAAAGVAGCDQDGAWRCGTGCCRRRCTWTSRRRTWTGRRARCELLTEAGPWPEAGRPRRAGVSSFGISGTNAHVILEQAPEPSRASTRPPVTEPAPVLAGAGGAVGGVGRSRRRRCAAQAGRLLAYRGRDRRMLVRWTWGGRWRRRSVFEHRAVVVGAGSGASCWPGWRALAAGRAGAGVVSGVARSVGETAFVFPGQGAQRVGMGRELYDAFPVFAEALDEVCAELDRHAGVGRCGRWCCG